ncbi:glycoside hydrolase family 3 protein [Novosphingobium sp. 9]|uniref:glycoside hydrolase family 3 protein n=1 Tax=Novosphingobium sp. 9 TaxID=2025349 RepID=UPI0021B53B4C|nr:glycoside hydrolase family 3 N-terminal domain-containing protein [Novosphingobium sp. 9]
MIDRREQRRIAGQHVPARMLAPLAVMVSMALMTAGTGWADAPGQSYRQPEIASHGVPVLTVDGLRFRDLNRNGRLDRYEDWRLSPKVRAQDLLARMTLEEKAGQMVLPIAFADAPFGQPAHGYDPAQVRRLALESHVTAFSSMLTLAPADLARAANAVQDVAEQGRLGIPATLATDPRHGYHKTVGASVATAGFSQWPDPTGLGAIGDPALVYRFADIVRRDYRAVGFTISLGPQADLATEPRWPRIDGTFGEDPASVGPLVAAYVEGAQGSRYGVTPDGIAAVVKHWVGYGAAQDGWDSHNYYGRFSALRTQALPLHLKPFAAAFAVQPAAVMPSYSVFAKLTIDGKPAGPTGAAFSAPMIHDLLRGRYHYQGIVLSDWAVTADCTAVCRDGVPAGQRPGFEGIAMPWGVEGLTRPQRYARAINAGVDQFGGESDPAPIVAAVRAGLVSQARIDEAVLRILTQTFRLGLFEHPFVSPEAAARDVGAAADREAGLTAQAQAMVVLKSARAIPFARGARVYLRGVDPQAARTAGFTVVAAPEKADFAIVRMSAPHQNLHRGYFFGAMQHEGSLAFPASDPDLVWLRAHAGKLPVIVDVYLDRPAVLTPLVSLSTALVVDFGACDEALFAALAGRVPPQGRLPFELPRSEAAVEAQASDLPADSHNPLFPIHFRSLALPRTQPET